MHHISLVSYGTGEKLTSTVFRIITLVLSSLPTLRWSACGLTTELLYMTLSPRIYHDEGLSAPLGFAAGAP